MKTVFLSLQLVIFSYVLVMSQDSGDQIFAPNTLHEIKFEFDEPDYWQILTSNYENNADVFADKPYLMGSVEINGEVVDSIGLRFKGFTSYQWNSDKKPLKIDFNEFVPGKRYNGLRKLNLNNATADPAMHRDIICYDLLRAVGVKAPRTSFAKVYFNDVYWGLYQVIEQVDKEFLQNNFSNAEGNLFKNLSWSKLEYNGPNTFNYNNIFSLKTNREEDDWSGFIDFVDMLNNSSDTEFEENIQSAFNVPLFLKTLAVDVATNNWDSYMEHGRNWYMYEDTNTGQIHWIPWDYNLALGGQLGFGGDDCFVFANYYTLQDGSNTVQFIDASWPNTGLSYVWDFGDGNTSTEKNPTHTYDLAGNYQVCVSAIDVAGDCSDQRCENVNTSYSHYDCHAITSGDFSGSNFEVFAQIISFSEGCCGSWTADCQQFYDDITGSSGGGGNFAIDQSENQGVLINRILAIPALKDQYYREFCSMMEDHFVMDRYQTMMDDNKLLIQDALQDDPHPLDSYDSFLADIGELGLPSYLRDRIDNLNASLEELGVCNIISTTIAPGDIVINEFMASNDSTSTIVDQAGETDDWIELYNITEFEIDLSETFLSDDPANLEKWQFPSGTTIGPNDYLIIWADKDEDQPGLHADFKLSKEAEEIILSNDDGSIIDETSYTEEQVTNMSSSRIPNGTGDFVIKDATIGFNNEQASGTADLTWAPNLFKVSPNPSTDFFNISLDQDLGAKQGELVIVNTLGQQIWTSKIERLKTTIDISSWATGLYMVQVTTEDMMQYATTISVVSR